MNEGYDSAEIITDLARTMHDTRDAEQTVRAIFNQITMLLPDVTDASITVRRRRGSFGTLGSSSELAREANRLQYELGEGPCVEAASPDGEGLLISEDLRSETRWPRWGSRAAENGVGSLLSVALLQRGAAFGAINIYSRQARRFADPGEINTAQLWATHAAAALSAARIEGDLHTAISARHTIGMAQGMLMERHGLSADASFRFLTRLASHLERRLSSVAAEIVETREVPRA